MRHKGMKIRMAVIRVGFMMMGVRRSVLVFRSKVLLYDCRVFPSILSLWTSAILMPAGG